MDTNSRINLGQKVIDRNFAARCAGRLPFYFLGAKTPIGRLAVPGRCKSQVDWALGGDPGRKEAGAGGRTAPEFKCT